MHFESKSKRLGLLDGYRLMLQEKAVKYKVLADGVEAMLGAYLLAGGLEGAWAALAAFNILPVPEDVVYPAPPETEETHTGPVGLLTEEVVRQSNQDFLIKIHTLDLMQLFYEK